AAVRQVRVATEVAGYIVDLCRATRQSPSLRLGVSPRGATALQATSRAWAWGGGPRLRDPGRREGAGQAHPAAPDRAAPGSGTRGPRAGRCAGGGARLCAGPPVTGRWH